MNVGMKRHVVRWLEAEAGGLPDEADHACRRALGGMRRERPRPGFTGRVLAAAGIRAAVREADLLVAWWMRALVGGALGLAGLVALNFPLTGLLTGVPSFVAWGLGRGALVLVEAGAWVRVGWQAASVFVNVGEAAQVTVRTPFVLGVLVLSLALCAAAVYALSRIVFDREELLRC